MTENIKTLERQISILKKKKEHFQGINYGEELTLEKRIYELECKLAKAKEKITVGTYIGRLIGVYK